MTLNRRFFLGSLGMASLGCGRLARAAGSRYPISFSTLGCPKWDWNTILQRASGYGFVAVELRGIQGEMDLTRRPEFNRERLKATLKDLQALDLRICGLGASSRMHEWEPSKRQAQLDEGRRFIDLAARLDVPYVRVFPDKLPPEQPRQATIDRIVEGLRLLGDHARGSRVSILLESHGDFTDSETLALLLEQADRKNVGLLWDTHHTVVAGKESPEKTFQRLKSSIRHVHVKDSKPEGEGRRYVLTGTGDVPLPNIIEVLARGGYRGLYGLEWEKGWHPEIEEPEVAFPHFVKTVASYFTAAGVKSGA